MVWEFIKKEIKGKEGWINKFLFDLDVCGVKVYMGDYIKLGYDWGYMVFVVDMKWNK